MPLSSYLAGSFLMVAAAVLVHPADGQAVPAAVSPTASPGFQLPDIGGSLRYSLTASEAVIFGYNGTPGTGANAVTNFSGDLAYLSRSENYPFSAVYSGGYLIGTSNQPSYVFQNLALSQVIKTRSVDFIFADSISYLPQTPVTGLSGIPGVGDLSVAPAPVGSTTGIGILSQYGTRINNTVSGSATYKFTAATTASATGAYSNQDFISSNTNGINNNQVTGSGNVNHRLDARQSIGGTYTYSQSALTNANGTAGFGFQSQSATLNYNRQLSRRYTLNLAAGPQRVSNSGLATVTAPSTNVTANANLGYAGKVYAAGLSYSRGVNNGEGVVIGSRSDLIGFNISRTFDRVWNVAGTVGYNHSTQLANSVFPSYTSSGVVAGLQASRQFHSNFTGFGSYTLQRQAFNGTAPGLNAFNGLSQVLAFGVSYSPRPFLGR